MRPFKNQIISISGFITKNTLGWNLYPQRDTTQRAPNTRARKFFWANDKMNWQDWYSRAILCHNAIREKFYAVTMLILDKKIIKAFLPFIGAMLIAFGYVKLSLYYNHFDISINNYLEVSEVLTLFLPDIIKYGLIIFMSFLFSFIIES